MVVQTDRYSMLRKISQAKKQSAANVRVRAAGFVRITWYILAIVYSLLRRNYIISHISFL